MEPVLRQIETLQHLGNKLSGLSSVMTIDLKSLFPEIERVETAKIAIVPPQNRLVTLNDTKELVKETLDKVKHSAVEGVISIFIDPDKREVFRYPRSENSYFFKSDSRILLLLSLSYQYTETYKLSDRAGYSTNRSVTTTIQKIRKQISKSLDVDDDIIEGSAHIGYRISPKFRILLVTDFKEYGA